LAATRRGLSPSDGASNRVLAPAQSASLVRRHFLVFQIGKMLLIVAGVTALVGLGLILVDRLGLGRLPGDIVIRGRKVVVHFPIVTSIIVSIVLTVVLNLWLRSR